MITFNDMCKYLISRLGIEGARNYVNNYYPTFLRNANGDERSAFRTCIIAMYSKLGEYPYSDKERGKNKW